MTLSNKHALFVKSYCRLQVKPEPFGTNSLALRRAAFSFSLLLPAGFQGLFAFVVVFGMRPNTDRRPRARLAEILHHLCSLCELVDRSIDARAILMA